MIAFCTIQPITSLSFLINFPWFPSVPKDFPQLSHTWNFERFPNLSPQFPIIYHGLPQISGFPWSFPWDFPMSSSPKAWSCAICLGASDGAVRQLPCGHAFHGACIKALSCGTAWVIAIGKIWGKWIENDDHPTDLEDLFSDKSIWRGRWLGFPVLPAGLLDDLSWAVAMT